MTSKDNKKKNKYFKIDQLNQLFKLNKFTQQAISIPNTCKSKKNSYFIFQQKKQNKKDYCDLIGNQLNKLKIHVQQILQRRVSNSMGKNQNNKFKKDNIDSILRVGDFSQVSEQRKNLFNLTSDIYKLKPKQNSALNRTYQKKELVAQLNQINKKLRNQKDKSLSKKSQKQREKRKKNYSGKQYRQIKLTDHTNLFNRTSNPLQKGQNQFDKTLPYDKNIYSNRKKSSSKNKTMQINFQQILKQETCLAQYKQYVQHQIPKYDMTKTVQCFNDIQKDRLMQGYKQKFEQQILIQKEKKNKTSAFKQLFLVGKQIGQGAYASVRVGINILQAMHKPTNKKVAIKIYQKGKIKQTQRKKSVIRQIKLMQIANHPNIVKIFDVIETNNHVNIIMEYISGISLSSYLKIQPNNHISQTDSKTLLYPLFSALSYLHMKSIAHRDIKLQNILLSTLSKTNPVPQNPYLIDFGFSTCINNNTKIKLFCGTPSYMSPQIVKKQEYQGPPADIWAMGVVMWVSLVGSFPFKGSTDKQLYLKISKGITSSQGLMQKMGCALIPSHLSKQAKQTLEGMFEIDPSKRIKAKDLLQSNWFDQIRVPKTSIIKKKRLKNKENIQINYTNQF